MSHTLAIIGLGGMGGYHAEYITQKIPNLKFKGFFDFVPENSKKLLVEKGVTDYYCYETLEELLNDEEIEVVTIAVPNNFHKNLSIACLRAGKNVICEKPVTMNAKELEEIIAVSKETGKFFTVHQNRRFDTDFCTVKKILEDKTVGEPYFIENKVQGSRGYLHGWRGVAENGGGMLYDWGMHLLDQVMLLVDSPVVLVDAHLFSVICKGVDDNSKLIIRFENGVSAIIEISTNCFYVHPRWHVSCSDGTILVEDWVAKKGGIRKRKVDSDMVWEDVIAYTDAGPTRTMAPRPKETIEELPLPKVTPSWSDYFNNIVDVLEGKAELIVNAEKESLRVMKVIDALFESQETGTAIKCRI